MLRAATNTYNNARGFNPSGVRVYRAGTSSPLRRRPTVVRSGASGSEVVETNSGETSLVETKPVETAVENMVKLVGTNFAEANSGGDELGGGEARRRPWRTW